MSEEMTDAPQWAEMRRLAKQEYDLGQFPAAWIATVERLAPYLAGDRPDSFFSQTMLGARSDTTTVKPAECTSAYVAPSYARRLNGYVRMNAYADTSEGRRKAHKRSEEYRAAGEGAVFVKVFRLFCRDIDEYKWTVWVKVDEDRGVVKGRRFAPSATKVTANIRGRRKKPPVDFFGVACPKCDQPKGARCISTLEGREGNPTTTHKERVALAYAEGGYTKVGDEWVKAKNVRQATTLERLKWLESYWPDKRYDEYEEAVDEAPSMSRDELNEWRVAWLEENMSVKMRAKYEAWLEQGVEDKEG